MTRVLNKIVDVRANELRALGLAFVFNFVVLGSYYVVRPIRDDIAATGGIETLPWMYTGTLVTMLVAANLILVTAAMLEAAPWCVKFFPAEFARHPERSEAESKDPGKVTFKSTPRDPSAVAPDDKAAEQPIGGGILAGITHVIRSPYLLGICGFVLLYTVTTTFSYSQQTEITGHQFQDRNARIAFFAQLDLVVNTLTVVLQLLITGHLMKRLGVGVTLVTMPLLSMVGFVALGFAPTLALLAVFQVARRATNFGFTRPAREVLFTVLRREDKYKAKSLIDTFVYRAGDLFGAWSYSGLRKLGLELTGISFLAVPLTAIWCALCFWLGKKQSELALAQRQEMQKPAVTI